MQDNYTEDDNDLYDDFLAGELLDDHTTDSIVPVYDPESFSVSKKKDLLTKDVRFADEEIFSGSRLVFHNNHPSPSCLYLPFVLRIY